MNPREGNAGNELPIEIEGQTGTIVKSRSSASLIRLVTFLGVFTSSPTVSRVHEKTWRENIVQGGRRQLNGRVYKSLTTPRIRKQLLMDILRGNLPLSRVMKKLIKCIIGMSLSLESGKDNQFCYARMSHQTNS